MGVNREDDDGSGDAWSRNSIPGDIGDFNRPNYLVIGLIVLCIVAFGVVIIFG